MNSWNRGKQEEQHQHQYGSDEQTAPHLQLIDLAPLETKTLETALRHCLLS